MDNPNLIVSISKGDSINIIRVIIFFCYIRTCISQSLSYYKQTDNNRLGYSVDQNIFHLLLSLLGDLQLEPLNSAWLNSSGCLKQE